MEEFLSNLDLPSEPEYFELYLFFSYIISQTICTFQFPPLKNSPFQKVMFVDT